MPKARTFLLMLVFSLTAIWVSQTGAQLQLGALLYTPPLWANHFVCSIANVGSTSQLVSAKIFVKGKEVSTNPISGGCTTINLQPGQTCGEIASMQGIELAYCRISVAPGPKDAVRASLIATNKGTGRSWAVEAR